MSATLTRVRAGIQPGHTTSTPSSCGSAGGNCGSSRSNASTRISATARLRTQLWSDGTTCQGAHSVEVSRIVSSYAARELVPELAVVEVAEPELPALLRRVEPRLESPALLLLRDVEADLDDVRALVDEQPLELADVRVPLAPDLLGRELADAHRDHVLVVRPVEDPELARAAGTPRARARGNRVRARSRSEP